MKVNIKKEGKEETYNFISSWSDVTLETWVKIVQAETGSKVQEAEETLASLSNMPKNLIKQLSLGDVAIIMRKMAELQSRQDTVLKKVIEIDGVEYGMHPNLEDITLGEYADIETFIGTDLNKNLPELIAVLFRPIVARKNEVYSIEAYDGNIQVRAEIMKKMSAENVHSCLVFFWRFVMEFLKIMPSFLTERTHLIESQLQTETSQKSGGGSE